RVAENVDATSEPDEAGVVAEFRDEILVELMPAGNDALVEQILFCAKRGDEVTVPGSVGVLGEKLKVIEAEHDDNTVGRAVRTVDAYPTVPVERAVVVGR